MNGILLASGKGIRKGGSIEGGELIDMAPTILHMLGHPVPDDMDGKVLKDLFDESLAGAEVEAMHTDGEGEDTHGLTEAEEEELRQKLMGLGYL